MKIHASIQKNRRRRALHFDIYSSTFSFRRLFHSLTSHESVLKSVPKSQCIQLHDPKAGMQRRCAILPILALCKEQLYFFRICWKKWRGSTSLGKPWEFTARTWAHSRLSEKILMAWFWFFEWWRLENIMQKNLSTMGESCISRTNWPLLSAILILYGCWKFFVDTPLLGIRDRTHSLATCAISTIKGETLCFYIRSSQRQPAKDNYWNEASFRTRNLKGETQLRPKSFKLRMTQDTCIKSRFYFEVGP